MFALRRGSVLAASGIVAGSTIQLVVVACQPRTAEPGAPLRARAMEFSVPSAVPRSISSDSPPPPVSPPPEPTASPGWTRPAAEQVVELDETATSPEGRACWTIAERQAQLLRDTTPLVEADGELSPDFHSYCVPAGGGRVWSHLVSDARLVKGTVRAQWSAVIAEPGVILATGPKLAYDLTTVFSTFEDPPFLHFDYDGDGTDEFFHFVAEAEHGSGAYARISSELWTYREGRVVRYEGAPEHARLVRDLDHDGRPDLLFPGPYQGLFAYPGYCDGGVFDAATDPENGSAIFVAHSLPDGSFSTTDEVAAAALKERCPAPPDFSQANTEVEISSAIRCARAHGAPANALERTVAEACKRIAPTCPGQTGCLNQHLFDQWIHAPLPLESLRYSTSGATSSK